MHLLLYIIIATPDLPYPLFRAMQVALTTKLPDLRLIFERRT